MKQNTSNSPLDPDFTIRYLTTGDLDQYNALLRYAFQITEHRYLTEHVKYDRRYYSDRASMPYHSQTAIGALRDQVAICGGYSHAFRNRSRKGFRHHFEKQQC